MSRSARELWGSTTTWVFGILGMAAVLVMVAFLQYRWSVQTAEAAKDRIASDLQSFMMDWSLDLFEDLSDICVALQIEPDSGASEDWKNYRERYRAWRRTSDNAELVKNILLWETSRAEDPSLFRLDPDASSLREERMAEELRPLLSRLQANSSSMDVALRAWEVPHAAGPEGAPAEDPGAKHATIGWQFDPHIPAIVHPIRHHAVAPDKNRSPVQERVDWIVIVINRDALHDEVLPELTKQHFTGGKDQYLLKVSAPGWPGGVLYSSRELNRRQPARDEQVRPDTAMSIFGPPPPAIGDRPLRSIVTEVSIRSLGGQQLSAPTWFPVFQYVPAEKPWTLEVSDLSQSVEASFAKIRDKNLLTSGLVLAVLALAMGLTLRAAYRTRAIAQHQIEFVAAVSHELGTSLAVISSAAENMADGVVATPQSVRQYGTLIRNQGRQLMELVDDVLSFASISSAKTRYNLRPVSVSDLVENFLNRTSDLIRNAGFTVERKAELGLPPVLADPQALSRCLQNLVGNALKYGKPGCWIGIQVFTSDAGRPREVCVSVSDRGIGIANSELRRLFQPFYRSPAVTAAQIRGTGLGLAIARNITEGMGGKITVTSELGVGSTFTLHLPVANEAVVPYGDTVSDSIGQS
jgi:signal transduction histidine kinase